MASNKIKTAEYFEPENYAAMVIKNEHHGQTSLHDHEFFELVFIDRGIALHSHEGSTQILTTGDIFIILPGELHGYISTNETALYNCLFTSESLAGLQADLQGIAELSGLLSGKGKGRLERVQAGLAERQEILLNLQQLIWERLNRPLGWQLKSKVLLANLLLTYARLSSSHRLSNNEANANYRQILKAVDFIEHHFDIELPVEDVAREAGLSVSHLSRQFKGYLGTSPSEYIRNFRIAKAAELLRRDDLTVAEIAGKLGYGDVTLFSRQFRQVTGISPTNFRKNK